MAGNFVVGGGLSVSSPGGSSSAFTGPVTGTAPISVADGATAPVISFAIASQARGDMVYRNASAWTRRAVGTASQLLQSDGTDPVYASSWAIPSGGFISSGATPATSGTLLRATAGVPAIVARYPSSSRDIELCTMLDTGEYFPWGDASTTVAKTPSSVRMYSNGTTFIGGAGGTTAITITSTAFTSNFGTILVNRSAPSTPSGSSHIYASAGSTVAIGSSGTITALAPA